MSIVDDILSMFGGNSSQPSMVAPSSTLPKPMAPQDRLNQLYAQMTPVKQLPQISSTPIPVVSTQFQQSVQSPKISTGAGTSAIQSFNTGYTPSPLVYNPAAEAAQNQKLQADAKSIQQSVAAAAEKATKYTVLGSVFPSATSQLTQSIGNVAAQTADTFSKMALSLSGNRETAKDIPSTLEQGFKDTVQAAMTIGSITPPGLLANLTFNTPNVQNAMEGIQKLKYKIIPILEPEAQDSSLAKATKTIINTGIDLALLYQAHKGISANVENSVSMYNPRQGKNPYIEGAKFGRSFENIVKGTEETVDPKVLQQKITDSINSGIDTISKMKDLTPDQKQLAQSAIFRFAARSMGEGGFAKVPEIGKTSEAVPPEVIPPEQKQLSPEEIAKLSTSDLATKAATAPKETIPPETPATPKGMPSFLRDVSQPLSPKGLEVKKLVEQTTGVKRPTDTIHIPDENSPYGFREVKGENAVYKELVNSYKEEIKKFDEEYKYQKKNPLPHIPTEELLNLKPLSEWSYMTDITRDAITKGTEGSPALRKELEGTVMPKIDKANTNYAKFIGDSLDEVTKKMQELDIIPKTILGKIKGIIKPTSRAQEISSDIQRYGEHGMKDAPKGTMSYEDLVKKWGKETADKIVKANDFVREKYNEWIDKANDQIREDYKDSPPKKLAEKLIKKRDDYYRHGVEMSGAARFIKSMGGSNEITPEMVSSFIATPSRKTFSIMKQRMSNEIDDRTFFNKFKDLMTQDIKNAPQNLMDIVVPKPKFDAIGGMQDYIRQIGYSIHMNPMVKELKSFSTDLRKRVLNAYEETGVMPDAQRLLKMIDNKVDDFAGKTGDAAFSDILSSAELIQNHIKANSILGKASSLVAQAGNLPKGISEAGVVNFVRGLGKSLLSTLGENKEWNDSGFRNARYGESINNIKFSFGTGKLDIKNNLAFLMTKADEFFTALPHEGLRLKALKEGKTPEEARLYADAEMSKIVGDRRTGTMPAYQKNRWLKFLTPFQYEVGNAMKQTLKTFGEGNPTKIATLLLSMHLVASFQQMVTGNKQSWDPIGIFMNSLNGLKKRTNAGDIGTGVLEMIGENAGGFLSNVPGGAFIGSLLPDAKRKQFFGAEDPSRFGTGILLSSVFSGDWERAAYLLGAPFAGGQIYTTKKGYEAAKAGEVKTKSGDVIAEVKPDALKFIQMLAFGKNAIKEVQDHFDKEKEKSRVTSILKDVTNKGDYERAFKLEDKYKMDGTIPETNSAIQDAIKTKFDLKTTDFRKVEDNSVKTFKEILDLDATDRNALLKTLGEKTQAAYHQLEWAKRHPDTVTGYDGKPFDSDSLYSHLRKVRILNGEDPKSIPAEKSKSDWSPSINQEMEMEQAQSDYEMEHLNEIIEKEDREAEKQMKKGF